MKFKVFCTAQEFDGNLRKIRIEADAIEGIAKRFHDVVPCYRIDVFKKANDVEKLDSVQMALWNFCESFAKFQGSAFLIKIDAAYTSDEYEIYKTEGNNEN